MEPIPSGTESSSRAQDSRSRAASQLSPLPPPFRGFPGDSQERLWLHIQKLWITAFSNPHLNKRGREYSLGYRVQTNTATLMPAGLGSNCLSQPHAHTAHKYLQTFQATWNYAQSTFSVSQPQYITKNFVQKKRKKGIAEETMPTVGYIHCVRGMGSFYPTKHFNILTSVFT